MLSPSFRLLTKTLLLIIFLGFGKTFAQEATITSETESILFSETESLVQLMLDNEPGEGLSEEQLIAAASSLLESDEPYIDLSSSDIPFNGGYAGAVLSNGDGMQVIISFNSHNENIEVTHNGYDTPTSVRAGNIIVRWVGVEARVDIQIFENRIGVISLDAELEVKPLSDESLELLKIQAHSSSNMFISDAFPGNIIGSTEADTFTFDGPNSSVWSVSGGPDTQSNDGTISSINSTSTTDNGSAGTISFTGGFEYSSNDLVSSTPQVISGGASLTAHSGSIEFVSVGAENLVTESSIEVISVSFEGFETISTPNSSRGDRNNYQSSLSDSSEADGENSGGGSFSFLYILISTLLFLSRKIEKRGSNANQKPPRPHHKE